MKVPAQRWGTVSKLSLKTKWNCGYTKPDLGLKTNSTLPALDWEWQIYMMRWAIGYHFVGPPPPTLCIQASKMQTGQPKVWKLLSRVVDPIVSENFISCVLPFMSTWRLFSLSADATKENGQSMAVIYSGQYRWAWITRVHNDKFKSFIILSETPFCWWTPTPQTVRCCILLSKPCLK